MSEAKYQPHSDCPEQTALQHALPATDGPATDRPLTDGDAELHLAVTPSVFHAGRGHVARQFRQVVLLVAVLLVAAGCQTFRRRPIDGPASLFAKPPSDPQSELAGAPESIDEEPMGIRGITEKSTNRVVSFVTGREPHNKARAKELYQEADALFRQASTLPREQAVDQFAEAADRFTRAAQAYPGSAIEQDALAMAGESYFFADRLIDAEEAFTLLQKQHPRSRHNDRAAARLFEISQYWIQTEKAGDKSWMPVNFFDPKRPFIDADGHAIRVLDNIRYNDPTGMLSDDATMAAGVEKMRQGKYQDADEFFTDLRQTFPDSDHQFNAHIMGLRCKLLVYAGPSYSGIMLDEADKLLKQTRRRFPDRLSDASLSEELARISAEIDYKKAEKLVHRARYRERRKEYGAARVYYQEVLEKHTGTPFAEQARERLAAFADQPDVPPKRLAWLVEAFPNQRQRKPLILSEGGTVRR